MLSLSYISLKQRVKAGLPSMSLGTKAQIILLLFYALLSYLFFKQKQWPVALYYIGCIVKDAGVFILALLEKTK